MEIVPPITSLEFMLMDARRLTFCVILITRVVSGGGAPQEARREVFGGAH